MKFKLYTATDATDGEKSWVAVTDNAVYISCWGASDDANVIADRVSLMISSPLSRLDDMSDMVLLLERG